MIDQTIDKTVNLLGMGSEQIVAARVYLLLNDNLSAAQGKSITDTIAQAGYLLAILAAPQILIVDADTNATDALSSLVATTVLAIGVNDVSPLLEAATASTELTAQLTALQATTPSSQDAAEMTRPGKGADWRGLCIPTEEQ